MTGFPTLTPEVEAERWAGELDAFARARVNRPEGSAVRAAEQARTIAASIRDVAQEIRDARASNDHATMGLLLENLGTLRQRALDLLTTRGVDSGGR